MSILLALVLSAPAAALGGDLFVCAMDGRVATECCCPSENLAGAEPAGSAIQGLCCTRDSLMMTAPPAVRLEAQPLPRVSLEVIAGAAGAPNSSFTAGLLMEPRESRAPPAPPLALYIRLCSFLI